MKKYFKCIFLLILSLLALVGCDTGSSTGGGTVVIKKKKCNFLKISENFCLKKDQNLCEIKLTA